ncbi:hypothetical protein DCCM_2926 [Desulfocucumis palustris]|uniref:Uncharacterized protein n=1 Tax=Desulfocucumis palustris TaxID=1898651 RepID=A0A2L2XC61_9FIRM|nr:hypothetical protein DCCM_2926 [Desulfocucumis palustris]
MSISFTCFAISINTIVTFLLKPFDTGAGCDERKKINNIHRKAATHKKTVYLFRCFKKYQLLLISINPFCNYHISLLQYILN